MTKATGKNLVWVFRKLEEIRNTASRLEKEAILKEIVKFDKEQLREVLHYANHPFLNFNIRVDDVIVFHPGGYNEAEPTETIWPYFREALEDMNAGKLSGGTARRKVEELLSPLGDTIRHWFVCILNRDLKMGVAGKTIEKFFPDLLPDVTPMLAKAIDLTDEKDCQAKAGWYCEPKYDGLRALVFVKNGIVSVVSRAGKEMWNHELIIEEIRELGIDNVVFDGEFFAGNFPKTMSIVHTQTQHPDRHELKYFVFDVVPYKDWLQKSTLAFGERRDMLETIFSKSRRDMSRDEIGRCVVQLVPSETLPKGGSEFIVSQMQGFITEGHEGGMLKNPNGKYEWTRSKNVIKVKPVFDGDLEIYDFEVGSGKNKGRLGAILCRGEVEFFGKTYKIDTRVGGGFSDKQRDEIWSDLEKYRHTIVQVEFKEVANYRDKQKTFKLREPQFNRFRPDKER